MDEVRKPFRERRAARWLARAGVVLGCAVALGGGYAAAAGGLGPITVFDAGGGYQPEVIAAGPDGALWFSGTKTSADSIIGRISTDGAVDQFTLGAGTPGAIIEAEDGNLWFGDSYPTPSIGRITPNGSITEFPIGTGIQPVRIAADSAGNIWFTGPAKIGKLTPGGLLTTYTAGLNQASSRPDGIAAGPDGAMWFADRGTAAIGRITSDGTITEYGTGQGPANEPSLIARGPDGNMWFLDTAAIGRITPSGQITEFALPPLHNGIGQAIAAGADGNMWFTMPGSGGTMAEITPSGTIAEFSIGSAGYNFSHELATGSDGRLWVTGAGSLIARMDVGVPPASAAPPGVTGSHQQGDEQSCDGALWSDWAGQQPSLSAFAEDGYEWLLDGNAIIGQTAQSYAPTAQDVGHQLSCKVTATYTLFPATVSATSAAVTVTPSGTTTSSDGGASGSSGGGSTGNAGPAASPPPPPSPAPPSRAPASGSVPAKSAASVSILGVTTVHLAAKPPKLHVTLKASEACTVTLTLLSPSGRTVAGWKLHLARGTTKLALAVPLKARHKGLDTLRVQTGSSKAKTLRVTLGP